MIPDNVTLIVKAPNQQIEDQNIQCQTSWTVRQLKGHLSEVYPNKPKADEQKIIYSGQLLDDNSIIKDVLRHYEIQNTHTMHLVCSTKRMQEPVKKVSSDGLRQRAAVVDAPETPRPTETPRPEMRQNDQNHTVEMQNYFSSFVNNYGRVPPYPNYNFGEGLPPVNGDPASMANHMLMMQQAYMQYMQQYANMAQTPDPPTPQTPEQPPRLEPEQDEQMQRDWLDHLYAASRFAILVSLFCIYGSPARLLLIILLAAAGYLHQIGFFRDLNVNPVNNGGNRRERNANGNGNANEPVPNGNGNGNEPRPNGNDTRTTDNENNDDNQSLLSVTWMIFTSFFASLIPDIN